MEENPYKSPAAVTPDANPRRTGLLSKTNPMATRKSVIRHAVFGAVFIPVLFVVFGKPAVREHWAAFLPVFAMLGAAVAAICEWQINDGPDDRHDE